MSLALLCWLGGVGCCTAGDYREHGPPALPEGSWLQAVVHPSTGRILLHGSHTESKRFLFLSAKALGVSQLETFSFLS